jgi:hypothetical protein
LSNTKTDQFVSPHNPRSLRVRWDNARLVSRAVDVQVLMVVRMNYSDLSLVVQTAHFTSHFSFVAGCANPKKGVRKQKKLREGTLADLVHALKVGALGRVSKIFWYPVVN